MEFSKNFELTEAHNFDKKNKRNNGDVAQMGERGVRNAEVRGSIPLISTIIKPLLLFSTVFRPAVFM